MTLRQFNGTSRTTAVSPISVSAERLSSLTETMIRNYPPSSLAHRLNLYIERLTMPLKRRFSPERPPIQDIVNTNSADLKATRDHLSAILSLIGETEVELRSAPSTNSLKKLASNVLSVATDLQEATTALSQTEKKLETRKRKLERAHKVEEELFQKTEFLENPSKVIYAELHEKQELLRKANKAPIPLNQSLAARQDALDKALRELGSVKKKGREELHKRLSKLTHERDKVKAKLAETQAEVAGLVAEIKALESTASQVHIIKETHEKALLIQIEEQNEYVLRRKKKLEESKQAVAEAQKVITAAEVHLENELYTLQTAIESFLTILRGEHFDTLSKHLLTSEEQSHLDAIAYLKDGFGLDSLPSDFRNCVPTFFNLQSTINSKTLTLHSQFKGLREQRVALTEIRSRIYSTNQRLPQPQPIESLEESLTQLTEAYAQLRTEANSYLSAFKKLVKGESELITSLEKANGMLIDADTKVHEFTSAQRGGDGKAGGNPI